MPGAAMRDPIRGAPTGRGIGSRRPYKSYSRFIIASASFSRSTYCSLETSTIASLMVPPVNAKGLVPE